MSHSPIAVLFVCMGNICRSPTAQGVAESRLQRLNLATSVLVDSAGTHSYHTGNRPDPRAIAAAAARGIDLRAQRARQVGQDDFRRFHYLVAMDGDNLARLQSLRPDKASGWLGQLGQLSGRPALDVPDPYYGGADGFEHVLDLLESNITDLLQVIIAQHNLSQ